MIWFVLFVVIMAGIICSTVLVKAVKERNKETAVKSKPKVNLSGVGKQVLKEYNTLPYDSRNFGDIETILSNLDALTSHKSIERRRHFDRNWLVNIQKQNGDFEFSWSAHHCAHNTCDFMQYHRIHRAIERVRDSINEKELAIKQSQFAGNNDMIEALISGLRQERDLNLETAQQFKQLS